MASRSVSSQTVSLKVTSEVAVSWWETCGSRSVVASASLLPMKASRGGCCSSRSCPCSFFKGASSATWVVSSPLGVSAPLDGFWRGSTRTGAVSTLSHASSPGARDSASSSFEMSEPGEGSEFCRARETALAGIHQRAHSSWRPSNRPLESMPKIRLSGIPSAFAASAGL